MLDSLLPPFRRTCRFLMAWWPWLLVLWPVLTMRALLGEHAINAPFLDDLMSLPLLDKARHGALTWHDFFAGQMEHRIAWTRLVLVAFFKLCKGHFFIAQVWFSWVLLCLTLVNIGLLLWRTAPSSPRRAWPVAALAALSLFSPVQFQILLWPLMHQVVGLAFFLTAGLVIWQTSWPLWLRFGLALACALCATLSFSSGILLWLVWVPVIWYCAPFPQKNLRAWTLGLWLAAFGVTMALYFHDLKNEVDPAFSLGQGNQATMSRDMSAFLASPGKSLAFAARVLGSPLARGMNLLVMDASLEIGVTLAGIYFAVLLYAVWQFRDADLRRRLMPWLALGAYGIGTALAIALGRVWLTRTGINAVSGRYLVHAVPLTLALPPLAWIVSSHLALKLPRWAPTIRHVMLGAGVALAVIQVVEWHYGEHMMEFWSSSCMRRSVNTLFYKTPCPIEHDYVNIRGLQCLADDLGLLRPHMVKSLRLDNFKLLPHLLNFAYADLVSIRVEKADDALYADVQGYAMLQKEGRVADGIFLAYQDPTDRHWEIFHVTQVTAMPLYLAGAYAKDLEYTYASSTRASETLSSFDARFKLDALPKGTVRIAAWAYNYRSSKASLMPGFFEVDTMKGTVKPLGTNAEALGFLEHQAAHP